MVHAFKFDYKGRSYHFLWDVESGSLHNVDYSAYLAAKNRYQSLDGRETEEYSAVADKDELQRELQELEALGELNSPLPSNPARSKPFGTVKALCLHICHDCNLRCSYCFAEDGTYRTAREYMTPEVGKAAIDFLIRNSGGRSNLEVDFFGGEPLMNFDAVKEIVAYARGRERETQKKFSFTITTNCMLLDDEKSCYLNDEMHNVVLSIDGRRAVHDAVRKTAGGSGSYDKCLHNALRFVSNRGEKSYYVRGTFTHNNTDFLEDVKALREAGFRQISLEPAVLSEGDSLYLDDNDIIAALAEYDKLAEYYIDMRGNSDTWFNFFHFMLDLENGPCISKRLSGCGAGCEYYAVTPTGDIYPCHQFAGDVGHKLGSVLSDERISEPKYSANIVNNKQACADCPAKYYCSGGCMANNLHYEGDMNVPYARSCKLMRRRFELSLAIAAIEASGEFAENQ